jgi:hypothetical protein
MTSVFKKYIIYSLLIIIVLTGFSACAVGSGCPAEKAETARISRKGQLKSGEGKTRLFPKDIRR